MAFTLGVREVRGEVLGREYMHICMLWEGEEHTYARTHTRERTGGVAYTQQVSCLVEVQGAETQAGDEGGEGEQG